LYPLGLYDKLQFLVKCRYRKCKWKIFSALNIQYLRNVSDDKLFMDDTEKE
jgi:hypothetical protein